MEQLKQELKEKIIEALNLEEITPEEINSSEPLFGEEIGRASCRERVYVLV